MHYRSLPLLVGLLLSAQGCVWHVYNVARSQAAGDLACPAPRVRQAYLASGSAYHYRFQGCNREVILRCTETLGSDNTNCTPEYLGPMQKTQRPPDAHRDGAAGEVP